MSLELSERVEMFTKSLLDISKFIKGSVFFKIVHIDRLIVQNKTLCLLFEKFTDFSKDFFPQINLKFLKFDVKYNSSSGDIIIKYAPNKYFILFHYVKFMHSKVQLEHCNHRNKALFGNEITHRYLLSPIKPSWNWKNDTIDIDGVEWHYISYELLLEFLSGIVNEIDETLHRYEPVYWYKLLHIKEFHRYCEFCKQSVNLLGSNLNGYYYLPSIGSYDFNLHIRNWHFGMFTNRMLESRSFLKIETNRIWYNAKTHEVGTVFFRSEVDGNLQSGSLEFRYIFEVNHIELTKIKLLLSFGIIIEDGRFKVFIETNKESTFYFKNIVIKECLLSKSSNLWLDFLPIDIVSKNFQKYPVLNGVSNSKELQFYGDNQNLSIEKNECFYYKELYLLDLVKTDDLFSLITQLFEELDNAIKNPNNRMSMLLKHL